MTRFRILLNIFSHGSGKTVERFPQIHRPRTVINSYRTAEAEHDRVPIHFNTSDSVAPSKPFSASISIPPTVNLIPDAFPTSGIDETTLISSSGRIRSPRSDKLFATSVPLVLFKTDNDSDNIPYRTYPDQRSG